MDISKQSQTAGDNSTQVQAEVVNNYNTVVNNGINLSEARTIWKEDFAIACREWTQTAVQIAEDRVQKLEDKVMPKMLAYDKSLHFFADPAFQFILRKAQITAASTERDADYDMLADLLQHRLEQGDDRHRRLGISKAIEIVDQVSDEALIAISIFYAFTKFAPLSNDLKSGLTAINTLYDKILCGNKLPYGTNWLEHLDLLGAIRLGVKGFGSFKKTREWLPTMFDKHFVCGVHIDSPEYAQLQEEFIQSQLPLSCFEPHPLKPNYVKLKLSSNLDEIRVVKQTIEGYPLREPLNNEQKKAMDHAINITRKVELDNPSMKEKFIEKWNKYTTLQYVGQWWDKMPIQFSITPVGEALANAYIHGKDSSIPCMY